MKKVIVPLLLLVLLAFGCSIFGDQIRQLIQSPQSRIAFLHGIPGRLWSGRFSEQGGASSDAELAAFLTKLFTKGLYKYEPPEQLLGCSTIAAQLT